MNANERESGESISVYSRAFAVESEEPLMNANERESGESISVDLRTFAVGGMYWTAGE